jgi:hypothetical protein
MQPAEKARERWGSRQAAKAPREKCSRILLLLSWRLGALAASLSFFQQPRPRVILMRLLLRHGYIRAGAFSALVFAAGCGSEVLGSGGSGTHPDGGSQAGDGGAGADALVESGTQTDAEAGSRLDAGRDAPTDAQSALDSKACPAAQPASANPCKIPHDQVCLYDEGLVTCTCDGQWGCLAPCPATQPPPGEPCNVAQQSPCMYGSITCQCMGSPYEFFCN